MLSKDILKKYKGSVIDEEESTGDIEALIFNQLKKEKKNWTRSHFMEMCQYFKNKRKIR